MRLFAPRLFAPRLFSVQLLAGVAIGGGEPTPPVPEVPVGVSAAALGGSRSTNLDYSLGVPLPARAEAPILPPIDEAFSRLGRLGVAAFIVVESEDDDIDRLYER